jgi:hypothetical protein
MKKPKRKKCKYGCGLIPIEQFDDHVFLHEAQTSLVPLEQYTVPVERVRRPRKVREGA